MVNIVVDAQVFFLSFDTAHQKKKLEKMAYQEFAEQQFFNFMLNDFATWGRGRRRTERMKRQPKWLSN